MNNENKEMYEAAFAEASLELKNLFGKIEQLNMRKDRIEQVVKVLGRKIGAAEVVPTSQSPPEDASAGSHGRDTPYGI